MELLNQIGIVNWWAIFTATALAFVLGGLWYGPLFGAAWLDAIGKTEADLEPSATPFVVSFFAALLTAVVLALLLVPLQVDGWLDGAVPPIIATERIALFSCLRTSAMTAPNR